MDQYTLVYHADAYRAIWCLVVSAMNSEFWDAACGDALNIRQKIIWNLSRLCATSGRHNWEDDTQFRCSPPAGPRPSCQRGGRRQG